MMDSKTRAKLRSYANTVEAILQVGKNGIVWVSNAVWQSLFFLP